MDSSNTPQQKKSNRIQIALNLQVVSIVLVLIIVGMLAAWRPWDSGTDRTIEINGSATITTEPDEFEFFPSYQVKGTDRDEVIAEVSEKSRQIVEGLKGLGLEDSNIRTSVYEAGKDYYKMEGEEADEEEISYELSFTINVKSFDKAQEVQDYLVTTSPGGSVSPAGTLSNEKRRQIESEARQQATADARHQAEETAKTLGARLGSVKTVSDSTGFGDGMYFDSSMSYAEPGFEGGLPIQPGPSELTFYVYVTYYIH